MYDTVLQELEPERLLFLTDIIDGKIWIQDDWTDYSIARELTDRNIAESDIVLAFQPKEIKETMSFAVQ